MIIPILKKMRLIGPLLIFLLISVFLWRGLHQDPHHIPSPLINQPVPLFESHALSDTKKMMTANIFRGHVSILHVFATWCVACQAEHPLIMDIANSKAVVVYGLDYKDNRSIALQWLAKYGNPYHDIIADDRGELGINLGVYGTPETFLIDKNGIIRAKFIGPLTKTTWIEVLLPKIRALQQL